MSKHGEHKNHKAIHTVYCFVIFMFAMLWHTLLGSSLLTYLFTHLLTMPVLLCLPATDIDAVDCLWTESDEIVLSRRRAFCRSVEGLVDVCRCHDPSPIVFSPVAVSLTVLAVNRIPTLRRNFSYRLFHFGGSWYSLEHFDWSSWPNWFQDNIPVNGYSFLY